MRARCVSLALKTNDACSSRHRRAALAVQWHGSLRHEHENEEDDSREEWLAEPMAIERRKAESLNMPSLHREEQEVERVEHAD